MRFKALFKAIDASLEPQVVVLTVADDQAYLSPDFLGAASSKLDNLKAMSILGLLQHRFDIVNMESSEIGKVYQQYLTSKDHIIVDQVTYSLNDIEILAFGSEPFDKKAQSFSDVYMQMYVESISGLATDDIVWIYEQSKTVPIVANYLADFHKDALSKFHYELNESEAVIFAKI
ncbi:hypothetical protein [Acinetobacter sp. P1(2025)]|uniref:hypothetical protein n=1 Tax=Acinetobacter sp. P1(2025) TaxID=3446120 RepID=UPI003F52D3DD